MFNRFFFVGTLSFAYIKVNLIYSRLLFNCGEVGTVVKLTGRLMLLKHLKLASLIDEQVPGCFKFRHTAYVKIILFTSKNFDMQGQHLYTTQIEHLSPQFITLIKKYYQQIFNTNLNICNKTTFTQGQFYRSHRLNPSMLTSEYLCVLSCVKKHTG